jgi:hypothetical protein
MRCYGCGEEDGHLVACPNRPKTATEKKESTKVELSREEKLALKEAEMMSPAERNLSTWTKRRQLLATPHSYAAQTVQVLVMGMNYISPMDSSIVPPHTTVHIANQPNVKFRPLVFYVDGTCAPYFDIEEIRIAQCNKSAAYGPYPASVFALRQIGDEVITQGMRINWETVQVTQIICLRVRNVDHRPQPFRAAFEGLGAYE